MEKNIKDKIEVWLQNLNYCFNNELNAPISKVMYFRPSYKLIADNILMCVEKFNSHLNSGEAWLYTTKLVDSIKTNLIVNNKNFQSAFKGEFFDISNHQNNNIYLYDDKHKSNNFYYLKNIPITSMSNQKELDFLLIINGFPMVNIEIVDSELICSDIRLSSYIEDIIDEFPDAYTFNKIIIFTDGTTYKVGTMYDFIEDYIIFNEAFSDDSLNKKYPLTVLNNILNADKIMQVLIEVENTNDINNYIKKNIKNFKILENENIDLFTDMKDERESEIIINEVYSEENEHFLEDDTLELILDSFNPNLDEVIFDKKFIEKVEDAIEIPDFTQNKLYIEDYQSTKNHKTLELIVEANKNLVKKYANKYKFYETSSLNIEDMYQLGYMGLIKAVNKFDCEAECELSTYAHYWINQFISRGIKNYSLNIRLPVHVWDHLSKLKKYEKKSLDIYQKIDYEWIRTKMGISKEKIDELIAIRSRYQNNISIDIEILEGDNTTLLDMLHSDYNLEEDILKRDLIKQIQDCLDILDKRSKDIIIKRFGLNGEIPMTLEEIGALHNITRERVRQIEKNSLLKLKQLPITKNLLDYCEEDI